ncbi:MAG: MbtH family NRPS accessory protein [Acidimicrobiales bacterium]
MPEPKPRPAPPSPPSRAKGTHKVVVNHEEQFSIVPVAEKLSAGWRDTVVSGTRAECQAQIARMSSD